jgi:arabinogalactan oligomer / maltooligosaccharide transport system permease protein
MTFMPTNEWKVESPRGDSILLTILKYIGLFLFNAFALILIYTVMYTGNAVFAVLIGIAALVANVAILVPGLYPIRWMVPGLVLLIIFVVYPIVLTVMTAFTNRGSGNDLTKQEVINLYNTRTTSDYLYAPPNSQTYSLQVYLNPENQDQIALWLTKENEDGTFSVAFAPAGAPIIDVDVDSPEPPETFEGYVRGERRDLARLASVLPNTLFGAGEDTAGILSITTAVRPLERRYTYDAAADAMIDNMSGTIYRANDTTGFFESESDRTTLNPGFRVGVGVFQFTRFFSDPRLQGPLIIIFIWTVTFATLSVFTTFAVGLLLALILNDSRLPGKKIIRSLLIVPYAMPGVISILVWRGMLNEQLGIVTEFVKTLTGISAPWFSDALWTRGAVILVNLWLGYPYMMLITSGALQAIPSEIYEAAAVDGATRFTRFFKITLPLLLVTVGPLLIASFIYNFNNFMLIEALTGGAPPIPNSPTVAGYTDILISYVYRLAFGGRGAEYGYAAAITLVIFMLVAAVTLFQSRITKGWEEVSENV